MQLLPPALTRLSQPAPYACPAGSGRTNSLPKSNRHTRRNRRSLAAAPVMLQLDGDEPVDDDYDSMAPSSGIDPFSMPSFAPVMRVVDKVAPPAQQPAGTKQLTIQLAGAAACELDSWARAAGQQSCCTAVRLLPGAWGSMGGLPPQHHSTWQQHCLTKPQLRRQLLE